MKSILRSGAGVVGIGLWLTISISTPLLIAVGLSLLGIPLDWGTWKTYVGLCALTVAMVVAK